MNPHFNRRAATLAVLAAALAGPYMPEPREPIPQASPIPDDIRQRAAEKQRAKAETKRQRRAARRAR